MYKKRCIDLVLVNPGSQSKIYQSLRTSFTAIEPPVWAGLMATFIRNHGKSVAILDCNAENLLPEQAAKRIIEMNPKLVSIVVYGHQPSASTQNMPAASELCDQLKQIAPQLKLLLVGGHVAALPERTLREEKADFVSEGEGLYTMLDLLEALESTVPDYNKVRGLWIREGKDAVRSAYAASLIQNLNQEMPLLAWDLLPMEKYRAHNWHCFGDLRRAPYGAFYTTLGCPYHCTFCCIQAPFKSGEALMGHKENVNSYRFWSPRVVIAQIEKLVADYGVRNIKIADEMFVLNARHVFDICGLIIERRLDLNIWAYARIDTVKDNMLEKLKKAGVNWLAFGIESASEQVRNNVQKEFDQDEIFRVIDKVRSYGINVIGNYIFGLPEDDAQTMKATLNLAKDLNCEFANFYCAMAYPGSPLYNQAIKSAWPLPEKWSGYSQHSVDMLPLPTKYLGAGEVIRFRDNAFQSYFSNPRYLEMVAEKFGPQTVDHIRVMTSHKLGRKFVAT